MSAGAPVSERITSLDVIRGFALFGILVVNLAHFSNPVSVPAAPRIDSALDASLAWLVAFAAQGKFYPLFALLFGVGFALQRECTTTATYVRRLLALLVIGVLHGVFIWAGDILTAYALAGFLLLLVGNAATRSLVLLAVIIAMLQLGLALLMLANVSYAEPCLAGLPVAHCDDPGTIAMIDGMRMQRQAVEDLAAVAVQAYRDGSYLDATIARAAEYFVMLGNLAFFGAQILFMFLLGALLGRAGVFANPEAHRRSLTGMLLLMMLVAVPLSVHYANLTADSAFRDFLGARFAQGFAVNLVAGTLFALGYAAAITLALRTRAGKWLESLAPLGRLALSNYLLQSIVCTWLFYGHGLGMMRAEPGFAMEFLIALLLFGVQVAASHWWLRRFHFGPAEWAWRAVTYGRLPAFRRRAAFA